MRSTCSTGLPVRAVVVTATCKPLARANLPAHNQAESEHIVKYMVSIDNGGVTESTHACTDMAGVSEFLVSYINDEHNENPGLSSINDVFLAFGALYAGLAQGGDFGFAFQGEDFSVEVEYDGLAELLDAWAAAECAACAADIEEGAPEEDTLLAKRELAIELTQFGSANAKWRMSVASAQENPSDGYLDTNDNVNVALYDNGTRVQWPLHARVRYRVGGVTWRAAKTFLAAGTSPAAAPTTMNRASK